MQKKEINYALVEDKRPPIYTSMKYWGKKPHNIWHEYIKNYTDRDGLFLDPFTGSAMSAIESFRAGKKTIAFDLNPLSAFVIETIFSEFNEINFIDEVNKIFDKVSSMDTYLKLYRYKSNYDDYYVHNVKWNDGNIYEICLESIDGKKRLCLKPEFEDENAVLYSNNIIISDKYPNSKFRKSDSFSQSFLEKIGNSYDSLYTKRNLWVLSVIFNEILNVAEENLKKQLIYSFIQTVHLSTKMCVPRGKKSNRDFSTSWGRSAFICSKKQMEMNPLLLFKNSSLGKQSTLKCLSFVQRYLGRKPIIADINSELFDLNKKVDIWYGIVDIKNISKVLPKESISFILTDPPYGGLVQYLDLSSVWVSWLYLYDNKYKLNYNSEITVNGKKDYICFERDFTLALKELNYVLKEDGKIVLTFNNKDLKIWNSFLKAIENSGFKIEKVIHQQNKRTGESNVSDPYGMSASDFYIRCIKTDDKYLIDYDKNAVEKMLLEKTIELIEERAEPTPYQILFNGLLVKLSQSNVDISSYDSSLSSFLNRHNNKEIFVYKSATNEAGQYWWIKGKKYNPNSTNSLTNRVKVYADKVLSGRNVASEKEIIQIIYRKFPNGLTPDIELIEELIKKYKS